MSTIARHPSAVRLTTYVLLPFVFASALWFTQSFAMHFLSQQFREVGYIEYGWFTRPEGRAAQFWIVLFPFFASIGALFGYAFFIPRVVPGVEVGGFRLVIWLSSSCLFVVLGIRTLMIAVQGYALIFI